MTKTQEIELCRQTALEIRREIITMTYATGNGGAHLGGSLSMVEMLATLYKCRIQYRPDEPNWEYRDRVILSKGHAALALYPTLAQAGIIERARLKEFKQNGSQLSGHPSMNGLTGIEFASGSLGQGLSLAVGSALALRRKCNMKSRVFVYLGDGECDEGSVWEAAASAAHYRLNNIIAIVDANAIQYDGSTEEILNMSPLPLKWESFGWNVTEIDGHDIAALLDAYSYESDKPYVIIANTIKGKGISFMEGEKQYHNARLSDKQYEVAMKELEKLE